MNLSLGGKIVNMVVIRTRILVEARQEVIVMGVMDLVFRESMKTAS
jgi:hypothetical protein